MKCIYCGTELEEGSNFCQHCGKQQKEVYGDYVQPGIQGSNNVDQIYQYHQEVDTGTNSVIFYLLLLFVIGSIGFCFLPYIENGGYSINYVYSDLLDEIQIKDGLLVVISSGIALLLLLFKRRIPVFIFQVLSMVVFAADYFNDKDTAGDYYAIGFYLVFVCLVVSIVLSLVRLIGGKRRFK